MRKMINENWKFVKAAENVADAVQAAGEVVNYRIHGMRKTDRMAEMTITAVSAGT